MRCSRDWPTAACWREFQTFAGPFRRRFSMPLEPLWALSASSDSNTIAQTESDTDQLSKIFLMLFCVDGDGSCADRFFGGSIAVSALASEFRLLRRAFHLDPKECADTILRE